jgi:hypothetical protein
MKVIIKKYSNQDTFIAKEKIEKILKGNIQLKNIFIIKNFDNIPHDFDISKLNLMKIK